MDWITLQPDRGFSDIAAPLIVNPSQIACMWPCKIFGLDRTSIFAGGQQLVVKESIEEIKGLIEQATKRPE